MKSLLWAAVAAAAIFNGVDASMDGDQHVEWLGKDGVPHRCEGEECSSKIWCFKETNRHADFSKIWTNVRLSAKFQGKTSLCLRSESEDTYLKLSSFTSHQPANVRLREKLGRGFSTPQQLVSWMDVFGSCYNNTCTKVVSPYGLSCISLCGQTVYGEVEVKMEKGPGIVWRYPLLLVLGIGTVLSAPYLSEQVVFYYASGVSLGVALSVLLLAIFIIRRTMPKNNKVLTLVSALLVQSGVWIWTVASGIWQNIISEHVELLLWYIVFAAFISLAATHWLLRGPDGVNIGAGMKEIVRGTITMVGLAMIFSSSQSLIWSSILVVCVVIWVFASVYVARIREAVLDRLQPNRGVAPLPPTYKSLRARYLSLKEYREEGEIETAKAMADLVRTRAFQQWLVRNSHRIRLDQYARQTFLQSETNES